MRSARILLLAGLATAAIGGAAIAATNDAHVINVRLPDGSIERIHYTGDVAPRVVLVPAARVIAADPFEAMFGAGSPFAEMQRVSAAMDAQADAMIARARMQMASAAGPGMPGVHVVSLGQLPARMTSYSMVSETVNGRTCTRTTGYVAGTGGARPQLVSQVTGDGCGDGTAPAARGAAPVVAATPTRPSAPAKVIPVVAPAAPKRPTRETI